MQSNELLYLVASISSFAVSGALIATNLFNGTTSMPKIAGNCPDPSRLKGICNDIYLKTEDSTNKALWSYAHERKVYDAACVNFSRDTPELAHQKIQNLWQDNPKMFTCNTSNFDVPDGNILKYAVRMQNLNFIDNAARAWKVDLNRVDSFDGKTVLDYVNDRLDEQRGKPLALVLQGYKSTLVRYGAKRCIDLPKTNQCR